MKILIVNAYSNSIKGHSCFLNFQAVIEKCFFQSNEVAQSELEFFIRDSQNIDDLLYELESSYGRKEAAKQFDMFDMIFIEGDPNIRPWTEEAQKFLILIRMCLMSRKVLFVSSFSFQALVYLCASNSTKPINVVNGKHGGKIGDLKDLKKDLSELTHTDIFLDNTNGDFYNYSYETKEWIPRGNFGLHSRKSAQEYSKIGKYMLKTSTYRPKHGNEHYNLFLSKITETICYVQKIFVKHWIFDGISGSEFLVECQNNWDVHPFNFLHKDKTFQVLGESQKGVLIIEMSNKRVIGTQFNISSKYPDSEVILRNFIINKVRDLKKYSDKMYKPITVASNELKNIQEEIITRPKKEGNRRRLKFIDQDGFAHVGYSYRKRAIFEIFSSNAIMSKNMKTEPSKPIPQQTINEHNNVSLGSSNDKSIMKYENEPWMEVFTSQEIFGSPKGKKKVLNTLDEFEASQFSRGEIIKKLHPSINIETFLKVPGSYSKTKTECESSSNLGTSRSSRDKIRLKKEAPWNMFCKYKEFQNTFYQLPNIEKDKLSLRISTPYKTRPPHDFRGKDSKGRYEKSTSLLLKTEETQLKF